MQKNSNKMKDEFKILIAPDSFKGSLSASKIADILFKRLSVSDLPLILIRLPLADGGEGSLEAIMDSQEFKEIKIKVLNPQLKKINAIYLVDKHNNTAYIELAQASGLGLINGKNNIMHASTYGTGQMIKHAIENGNSKIVLFLGGSATCDAGLGIADALGMKFYNLERRKIVPSPEKMYEISDFDSTASILNAKKVEILMAVDVNNPFFGENGASYVYSPQKGANKEQVKLLDGGLQNLAQIIKNKTAIDLQNVPGSGAAGGTAGGMLAFFDAKIIKGTEFIFNLIGLEEKIRQADLVISGEGKIDSQSMNNKLLYGISRLTAKYNKKLWGICGYFDGDDKLKKNLYLDRIFKLAGSREDIADSIVNVEKKLESICEEIDLALKHLINP
jgi:glycerate 2-kinase